MLYTVGCNITFTYYYNMNLPRGGEQVDPHAGAAAGLIEKVYLEETK